MKAISAVLVAFGATLALIAAIPIITAPTGSDVGQRAPLACSAGDIIIADRDNPTTATIDGPAGSSVTVTNETVSVSSPNANVYANDIKLGVAPGPYGASVSYPLPGEGPWVMSVRDGEASVCVRIVGPPSTTVTSTTVPESTTTSTPPESTTTTTVPVTSSSLPPTTSPTTSTTSTQPPATSTSTTLVPPTTRTPTPEPTCTIVGFDIPNVGEWRLTLNDTPATPTDEGAVLFVAANHGDVLGWVFVDGDVVLSGTLVHDCGEESG